MSATVDRLVERLRRPDWDLATESVVRAALIAADDVTHECGTPEATEAAVLTTLREAVSAISSAAKARETALEEAQQAMRRLWAEAPEEWRHAYTTAEDTIRCLKGKGRTP